jgi:hypothetical protein
MSVVYEIVLEKTFGQAFFFDLLPSFILKNINYYLDIENSCFNTIPKNILTKIQNKKLILILKLTNEGDIDEVGIKILKILLEKYKIATDSCILIHDSYRLPNTDIKNYQLNNHLFIKSSEAIGLNKQNKLNRLIVKNKQYKFHVPIRRFRWHRILLLNKLFEKYPNFIDVNLVSYDINTELNKKALDDFNASDTLKPYLLYNVSNYIDTNNLNGVTGYGSEFKEVYAKSYFTIVTETYFFEPYYYISEKPFKPIAHMHPFIICGPPGILEYLKKFGFKTFHPFIDERYDLEENNDKRMDMVYNEIIKLNELSNEELDTIMDNIQDTLYYNQQKLLEMGGAEAMRVRVCEYINKNLYIKNLI